MRDVINTEESYENARQVEWYEGEHRTRNRRENMVLETHKRTVETWKCETAVACAGRNHSNQGLPAIRAPRQASARGATLR